MVWQALIGAGASLLSSLLGGKKSKNRINYKQMVKDAEAAGFNPLTVLRNGGSAGYMQGGEPTPLSRLADGLGGAASTFLQNFDPFADDKREAEFRLVEAQIANLNADTKMKVRFGDVPTYTATPQKRVMGNGVKHGQTFKSVTEVLPASAGVSQTPTVEKPTVTNPWPSRWGVNVNPAYPDGQAYEDRYGEWGGALLAPLTNIPADIAESWKDFAYDGDDLLSPYEAYKRWKEPKLWKSARRREPVRARFGY